MDFSDAQMAAVSADHLRQTEVDSIAAESEEWRYLEELRTTSCHGECISPALRSKVI